MNRFAMLLLLVAAVALVAGAASFGCVQAKAPERIDIDVGGGHDPIDTSRVPPTASHEEARQKLAEAYREIDRLRKEVDGLKKDKKELKAEREEYKDKYEKEKKRNRD